MGTTIYSGFEEYRIPDEEAKTAAVKEGIVVLDANVLLNLYKMDESVSEVWMKAFKAVGGRLWIPHQAMAEFWRNRAIAAAHPQTAYQTRNKILSARKDIEEEYLKWSASRGETKKDSDTLIEAKKAVEAVITELDEFIEDRKNRFSTDPAMDSLIKSLNPLLSGKIGDEYNEAEYKRLLEVGRKRFSDAVPPGYKDKEKPTDNKYGDYILWRQTLDHFVRIHSNKSKTASLVLVTADMKDDWWQDVKGEGGTRKIARYELIVEARREAAASLILLTPADFLQSVDNSFGIGLSQEIIDSTQAASANDSTENSESPDKPELELIEEALYLTLFGKRSAEGYENERGIMVLSGHTRAEPTSTTPGHILNYRNTMLDDGIFQEVDDDTWELVEPHLFRSASTAAAVMLGRSANGLDEWKNDQGHSINQLRGTRRIRE